MDALIPWEVPKDLRHRELPGDADLRPHPDLQNQCLHFSKRLTALPPNTVTLPHSAAGVLASQTQRHRDE